MNDVSDFLNFQDEVLTPLKRFSVIVIPEKTFISRLNCKNKRQVTLRVMEMVTEKQSNEVQIKGDKTRFKMCSVE